MKENYDEGFAVGYGCFLLIADELCPEPPQWVGTFTDTHGRSHRVRSCDGHRGRLTNVRPMVGIIAIDPLESIVEYEHLAEALEEIAWALGQLDLIAYAWGYRWLDQNQLHVTEWPILYVGRDLERRAEKIRQFDRNLRSDG